jgi:hypothetical protein
LQQKVYTNKVSDKTRFRHVSRSRIRFEQFEKSDPDTEPDKNFSDPESCFLGLYSLGVHMM